MENSLVFVISHCEVFFAAAELLLNHRQVVLLKCVVEGQRAVVVWRVGPRINLVNDGKLLRHAHDVLNCASFIVLHPTGLEILVRPHEPPEDLLVSITRTTKKAILAFSISHHDGLELVVLKDFRKQ